MLGLFFLIFIFRIESVDNGGVTRIQTVSGSIFCFIALDDSYVLLLVFALCSVTGP